MLTCIRNFAVKFRQAWPFIAFCCLTPVILPTYMAFAIGATLAHTIPQDKPVGRAIVMVIYGAPFYVLNFLHNATVMTIILLEWPKEDRTTKRLARWKSRPEWGDKSRDEAPEMAIVHLMATAVNIFDPGHV